MNSTHASWMKPSKSGHVDTARISTSLVSTVKREKYEPSPDSSSTSGKRG